MTNAKTLTIFDFDAEADQEACRPIDDVVVGGVSASQFNVAPEGLGAFEGVLSLERGGFASVRSRPAQVDLSAYDGLELRVRGDGKRYRLRMMSFGWLIADKRAGPFRLEIDWVRAYADGAR